MRHLGAHACVRAHVMTHTTTTDIHSDSYTHTPRRIGIQIHRHAPKAHMGKHDQTYVDTTHGHTRAHTYYMHVRTQNKQKRSHERFHEGFNAYYDTYSSCSRSSLATRQTPPQRRVPRNETVESNVPLSIHLLLRKSIPIR